MKYAFRFKKFQSVNDLFQKETNKKKQIDFLSYMINHSFE